MNRRGYIDWLRGIAVLIMIEAHILDAWTRVDARSGTAYRLAIAIGGFGAPTFLFLAGIAMALAAGRRRNGTATPAKIAARARSRGWQILGLALLFRLQSWLISGGEPSRTLMKVDILNVMGVAMLLASALGGFGRARWTRALTYSCSAVALAMLTPIVFSTHVIDFLPDQLEWYLRPGSGVTTFAVFPWAGFLLAGGAVGIWLEAAGTDREERRVILGLAVLGPLVALGGYAASLLPPIYAQTEFWTSSPTFFFVRLGVLISALPIAHAWNALVPGRSPLREFGIASLFVYWIHVEMVYGVVSLPLHRQLPLDIALTACAGFSLFLFGLVKLRDRLVSSKSAKHVFQNAIR